MDLPRQSHATFPHVGATVKYQCRWGLIIGREFDYFTLLWYYRVWWADLSTGLVPMTALMLAS
ncbi:hypothetical protein [Kitasatospora sp. NPDC059571]|uniref:hypothetical protein n=1 Tax=Kitasatospora sp. NPDC059571 TaxID=3346871 RepID=UPI0036AB82B8